MEILLQLASAFFGKYWKHIFIIVTVVGLFFAARFYVLNAIEKHDQAIVTKTSQLKDAEWQSKLDKAQLQFQKDLENARQNQKALAAKKPRNMRATIDLLRRHGLNEPAN